MTLCNLCQSIPWHDLPPFPDDCYDRNMNGRDYFRTLVNKRTAPELRPGFGIPYHRDEGSLRRAAEDGCPICALIAGQVDAMLADFDSYDSSHINSKYDKSAGLQFWISKRPILGDGVWVMTWGAKTKGLVSSAATLAFVSDDGSFSGLNSLLQERPLPPIMCEC